MKNIIQALKVITLALILSFGISYVYAWTAPTVTPPNGNVSAPINTSATSQYKDGALGIGGLIRGYANAIFDGSVGVGTTNVTSWAKLEVNGNVSLTGDDGSGHSLITSEVGGKPLMIKSRAGNYPDLVVGTNGNVGIGTTAPQVELHVKPSDGSHGDIAIESNDGFKWTMSSINSNGAWVLNRNIPGDLSAIIVGQNGVTQLAGLNIPSNAGSGKVLTSDASGNATWQTAAGGGSGTLTSLSAGTGITLSPNPITTTGTISANTGVLQSRVTGSCAVGQAITAINADGTVTCGSAGGSGIGTTWTNVTASRAAGVTYTNNTGKHIQVAVHISNTNGTSQTIGAQLYISELPVSDFSAFNFSYRWVLTLTGIVPPGATYRVALGTPTNGGTYAPIQYIHSWYELR